MKSVHSKLLKAVRRNYYSHKYYQLFRLYLANLTNKEIVVVYQMGRVGSTSILRSLEASKLNLPIFHVHRLTKDYINKREEIYKKHFTSFQGRHRHLLQSQYLRQQINQGLINKKWNIVTLVRDPIAKNVSSFFKSGLELMFDYKLKQENYYSDKRNDVKELINIFLEEYNHEIPLTWFGHELKSVFEIDIFSTDFPKEKGYQIYAQGNINILIIKLEKINEIACDAFKEFLGINNFTLVAANSADEKQYKATYKEFIETINLPNSYIDRMYESKYVSHFYDREEIELLRAKWSKSVNNNEMYIC